MGIISSSTLLRRCLSAISNFVPQQNNNNKLGGGDVNKSSGQERDGHERGPL